ncbi:MAG: hypothetical protein LBK65_01115 [Tannerellaceae bacterium]|jgi:hypothetical protein|nr:hypothetical protein [Tannerellaceae bacterium]
MNTNNTNNMYPTTSYDPEKAIQAERDNINDLKNDILDLAEVITAAVVRKITPFEDEIPTRQVWREFGATWLQYQLSRNRIKAHRNGPYSNSPIMYSRTELLALKEAERRGARMVRK